GSDQRARGVLRVALGLGKLEEELRAARCRPTQIAALTILGVAAALVVFTGRLVLQPINRVATAARQIGSGDFDARVTRPGPDEIGQLGRVINDMAGRLSAARADLEARNAGLASTLQSPKEAMPKVGLLGQGK